MQEVPSAASAAVAKPFVHQPMPPQVSADYPEQRYFMRDSGNLSKTLNSADSTDVFGNFAYTNTKLQVYRNAKDDSADLTLSVRFGDNSSELTVACTAEQLRHVASMLLDAALDLDINPSAVLTRMAA